MSDNYSLAVGCIVCKGNMDVQEALEREDVTHMTKVALKAMISKDKNLLYSDEEYKQVRGNDFLLFI